jgi:hypothetical protein
VDTFPVCVGDVRSVRYLVRDLETVRQHPVLVLCGDAHGVVDELVGDYMVLSNGHSTYRFYWSNVLYCRSREKR